MLLNVDSFLEFVHEVLLPRSEVVSLENNLDYRSFSCGSIDEYFFYPDNNKNKRKYSDHFRFYKVFILTLDP